MWQKTYSHTYFVWLYPILIFACKLGVSGEAIAHVLSQYLISIILLVKLMHQVDLLPPSLKTLQFSRFLSNGKRYLALFPIGNKTMLHNQVWLTSSLLSDGLAVAGQMGCVVGVGLGIFIGLGLQFGSGAFTKDINVKHIITIGLPVCVQFFQQQIHFF
ncbi:putative multi antimicrobial extrusion protein DinF [Helianthus annuus]|nr:putative multi antimicrobial extrusion protein DinF [Helianthus annuus]